MQSNQLRGPEVMYRTSQRMHHPLRPPNRLPGKAARPVSDCAEGQFACADRTCISILGRCDHKIDCPHDRADEDGCRTSNSPLFL